VFQGRKPDYVITVLTSCFIATPNFFFGILVILLFAVFLGWLPAGGRADLFKEPLLELKFLALPALTLALPNAMGLSRLTKATTLEVLHEDFVRTARAKGLAGRAVIARHVFRNALVPITTAIGLEIGRLLGGAVIVESIFGWPGLGLLTISSINNRDYSVVQATVILLTLTFIVVSIGIDMLYGVVDPRIRLARRSAP
jgi:peptide/nickel transport system permease protein